MIRVTTNGTLRNYRSSLTRSANALSTSRDKVLTQRNFNSYAEDPAAATQAFKLRRAFSRTNDQLTSTQTLTKKYSSAYDALKSVKSDLMVGMGKVSALAGLSDSQASGRQPLGQVLKSSAESVVQVMNSQYGTSYIFGGSDALGGAPFQMTTAADGTHQILYRGIDVNSTDPEDQAKLKAMNAETSYVDVGTGLSEVDGKVIPSSAFNGAISGIEYMGYGLDDDGDPKNAASIMMKLSDIFTKCDAETGAWASDKDRQTALRLNEKLQNSIDEVTNKWTELSGQTTYLESNENRLTQMSDNLNEQILDIEQVNLANAITDFSWAQYCYNAALKVGSNILSQSLIDYMN